MDSTSSTSSACPTIFTPKASIKSEKTTKTIKTKAVLPKKLKPKPRNDI